MMLDSEIFVDCIASGRIHDMNVMLESFRQTLVTEKGADPDNLYMQTLKVGQIAEDDFLGSTITKDLMAVLSDIRDAHVTDSTTADTTATDSMKEAFVTATKLVTLINILRKSPLSKTPGNKRGKGKKKNRK